MPDFQKNNSDREAFARSVAALTPRDIPIKKQKKRSLLDYLFDHVRLVLLLVCGAILIWSIGYILNTLNIFNFRNNLYICPIIFNK